MRAVVLLAMMRHVFVMDKIHKSSLSALIIVLGLDRYMHELVYTILALAANPRESARPYDRQPTNVGDMLFQYQTC